MKLCTGISELNHGSVVQKHTWAKKDNAMEKCFSEATRGVLFEGILERFVRKTVEHVDAQNMLDFSVLLYPKRGRGSQRGAQVLGGVVPLIDLNELS